MQCDCFGKGCAVNVQRSTFRSTVAKVLDLVACPASVICQFNDPEGSGKWLSVLWTACKVFQAAGCNVTLGCKCLLI